MIKYYLVLQNDNKYTYCAGETHPKNWLRKDIVKNSIILEISRTDYIKIEDKFSKPYFS